MLKLRKVLSGLAAITMLCSSMALISATTQENANEQTAVAEAEQRSSITASDETEINSLDAKRQIADKAVKEYLTHSRVLQPDELSETIRDKYIVIENGRETEEAMEAISNVLLQAGINYRNCRFLPQDTDTPDSELNKIRKNLFFFILENNLPAEFYEIGTVPNMDDRIIIDYFYKDQIVPDMIYKFMDDNNYDRELLILGVSESAGNQTENKTKNYAYFSSLSDEEVIREYKAYRESVGNPITDKQIIQAVWYAANNRWQTSNQTPLKEIKNGNISDVGFTEQEAEAITSQPGVYFGFDDQLKNGDIGWGLYQDKYYMFFDLSLPERFKDSSAKEVLCEYMRRDLAMANSQFVKDYCPDGYVYTLGGADSAKSVLPVAGDANQDGKVTLADSLTILQFIANEEKYPLSKSGLAAADCYDPGDGITAMDALAVQKRDLGVLSSLPEIPGITDDNAGIKAELTVYLNENNIPAWIASGNWEVPDNKIAVEYYWVNKDVPEQIRAFMESRGLSYDMITYVIQE